MSFIASSYTKRLVNPNDFNVGKSTELCATVAEPHFVFNPATYRVDNRKQRDVGAFVQSLRSEVDWGRFYS